jgi:hypothetical protein
MSAMQAVSISNKPKAKTQKSGAVSVAPKSAASIGTLVLTPRKTIDPITKRAIAAMDKLRSAQ